MHDIEPYYRWISEYDPNQDRQSPFYGREYSEFTFHNKVYNYFIHPRWDEFGSSTLYMKMLYVSYEQGSAIIELIGEWNDCLHNDIMILKRKIIDTLIDQGIFQFVLIVENVMNFHGGDDDYYQEWVEDIRDEGGYILVLNPHEHVRDEILNSRLDDFVTLSPTDADFNWRKYKPEDLMQELSKVYAHFQKRLA